MRKVKRKVSEAAVEPQPSNQSLFFAPLRLLQGEDAATYEALHARLDEDVMPGDLIEEFWTRSVGNLMWEIDRYRRLKGKFWDIAAHAGMEEVLHTLLHVHATEHEEGTTWAYAPTPAEKLA